MRRNSSTSAPPRAALCAAALAVLCACTPAAESPVLFHRYAETDAACWQSADTVWFDLPDVETPTAATAVLSVRALQSYPYRNLSLRAFLRQEGRPPSSRRADFQLFGDNASEARHSPTFAEAGQPLDTLRLLPHRRTRIGVVHIMRQPDLPGVSHVGIKLTRLHTPARP